MTPPLSPQISSKHYTHLHRFSQRCRVLSAQPHLLAIPLLMCLASLSGCDDETPPSGGGETSGEVAGMNAGDLAGESAGETAGDQAGDAAGEAAGDSSGETAGDQAGDPAGDSAGDMAGDSAGDLAGTPAGEVAGDLGGEMAGTELPAECLERPSPRPQPEWRQEALCQGEGEGLKIRHLRDPRCASHVVGPDRAPGVPVVIEGVVVTRVFEDKMSVQDAEGGAYSGLWVFNNQRADFDVEPGSVVRLEGELIEFYTVTELILDRDGLQVIGQQPVPQPIFVSDPTKIADGGEWVEPLESVLVELEALTVTNTAPDCPRDFDMFVVDESLRLSREVEFDYTPARSDLVTRATGVLHFSFDHQKLLLASEEDLEVTTCGGVPDKCEASECRVEPDAAETGQIIITEIQNNPIGEDDLREYVELYNPNATPVSIDGWVLQSCSDQSVTLSGEIPGRDHFVVARSLNRQANGGVDAQSEMGDLFLSNGYGSVLLFNQNDALVDQVRYEPGGEAWPSRSSGEALELLEPASDNRLGASWVAGNDSYGDGGKGSPGRATR